MPKQQFSETLHMKFPADDLRTERERIGRATMTVFAITTGSVTTESPLGEEVASAAKMALEAGGYRVEMVKDGAAAQGRLPLVKVAIKELWFKNYNWLWPLVPTWGDIEIALVVESASGQQLLERSFKSSGNSFCLTGHCAFTAATKQAMTAIVQQIRDTVMSEDFRRIIAPSDSRPRAEIWLDHVGPAGKKQRALLLVSELSKSL